MARRAQAGTGTTTEEQVGVILGELRGMGSEKDRAGMSRYGLNVDNAFGVSIYELRKVAKRLGTDHGLALALWATGNHEACLLACFVADPTAAAEEFESFLRIHLGMVRRISEVNPRITEEHDDH